MKGFTTLILELNWIDGCRLQRWDITKAARKSTNGHPNPTGTVAMGRTMSTIAFQGLDLLIFKLKEFKRQITIQWIPGHSNTKRDGSVAKQALKTRKYRA